MDIAGRRPLVTGASRGLGVQFVEELLLRGADRVYAAVRNIDALAPLTSRHGQRVVPVRLDMTDPDDIRRVVERHGVLGAQGHHQRFQVQHRRQDVSPMPI